MTTKMGARRTTRARRYTAMLACVLWLLGVEVLPNVHLSKHDETPHTHAANGMVITVSFDRSGESGVHRHADGSLHDDHTAASPAKTKKRAPIDTSITAPLDNHAATGLAHRAVALLASPLPVLAIARIDVVATDLVVIEEGRATLAVVTTADARGPPTV